MNKEKENYPDWLVPLDIAKELKEIDFNEHCLFAFSTEKNDLYLIQKDKKDCVWYDDISLFYEPVVPPDSFLVPAWTDVLAWFRKRGLYGFITFDNTFPNSVSETFSFEIRKINRKLIYGSEENSTDEFNCYEEAREALAFKLIEIYKTQIITL